MAANNKGILGTIKKCGPYGFSMASIILMVLLIAVGAMASFYAGVVYTKKVIKEDVRSGALDSYIIFRDILRKSCYGAVYWLPYPKTPDFTNPIRQTHYEYLTSWFLSHLCENVSNSNCLSDKLPIPDSFDASKTIVLTNPNLNSIYGYIFYQPEKRTTYIVWSGTATAEMWGQDFKTIPEPVEYLKPQQAGNDTIKVHSGFVYIYSGIRDPLIQVLQNQAPITDHYVICGHSLGGGISQLSALDLFGTNGVLSSETASVSVSVSVTVYLFGSPRCGNLPFAIAYANSEKLKRSTFNIFNTEDLVPAFPTSGTVVEYTHVGQPIAFTANLGNASLNHIQAYIYDLYQTEPFGLLIDDDRSGGSDTDITEQQ